MPDDLRTRIAAAIWDELDRQREPGFGPYVDRENNSIDTSGSNGVDMQAVADAVIQKLGLRIEYGALDNTDSGRLSDDDDLTPLPGEIMKTRYITDWHPHG